MALRDGRYPPLLKGLSALAGAVVFVSFYLAGEMAEAA